MKKYLICFLVLFILIPFCNIYALIPISGGGTNQIMSAVGSAPPGEVIQIQDSMTYNESAINFSITASNVTIEAAPGQTPTLVHTVPGPLINVNANNVTIKNLRMIGNPTSIDAIYINGDYCKVINCTISGFTNGIQAYSVVDVLLAYNTIYGCRSGIYVWDPTMPNPIINVFNNTVVNNSFYGIVIIDTQSATTPMAYVKNNIAFNNGITDINLDSTPFGVLSVYLENNCYQNIAPTMLALYEAANININPMLSGDYSLLSGSPCIDAGANIDYASYGVFSPDVPVISGSARDIGANEGAGAGAFDTSTHVKLSANKIFPGKTTTISLVDLNKLSGNENGNEDKVYVKATVHDLMNRLVRRLCDETVTASAGKSFTWDGKDSNGKYVGASVYILRVQLGSTVRTRKIFFVK